MISAFVLLAFQQQLLGHWKQCLSVSATSSIKYEITFDENTYANSSSVFRSGDCSGVSSSSQSFSGSYELGAPVDSDTYEINYHRIESGGLVNYYDIIQIHDGKSWGGPKASTEVTLRPHDINSNFWMEKN